ncbi:hypothetical protein EV363DRAFT_1338840, partial [Boletus edulis]
MHGFRGYLVCVRPTLVRPMYAITTLAGISPLCMPCSCMSTMDFAGISSALADPCAIHAWLSRVSCLRQADPCASHLCDHGSGGYPIS